MSTTQYFDIHSHLYFPEYDKDRQEVVKRMQDAGVGTITIGTNIETSKKAIETMEWGDNIYATVGLHPADLHEMNEQVADLKKLVTHPKVVAIGECGMDFFRMKGDEVAQKALQKKVFEEHIELAIEADKPLMIHCRNAYPEVLDILTSKKKVYGDKLRGNFHFFTEPIETAKKILELGFTVSFTGPITFVSEYADIVSYVPLTSMMSETDAPFAAPVPYRGKRNEPAYVVDIIKKIAEIKKLDLETVAEQLLKNTQRFFKI